MFLKLDDAEETFVLEQGCDNGVRLLIAESPSHEGEYGLIFAALMQSFPPLIVSSFSAGWVSHFSALLYSWSVIVA